MSRSYWLPIIAIVGLALCTSPPCNAKQPDPKEVANQIEPPAPSIVIEEVKEGPEYYKPCAQEQDNRESDLCAQWKAADAARESADWTRRAFWTALGGTVIAFLTLCAAVAAAWFAREAALHTERSADAAEDTLEEAKVTTRIELRARLSVLPRGINPMGDLKEGIGHVALKNIGKVPAQEVTLHVFMKFGVGEESDFSIPPDSHRVERTLQPDTQMIEGSKQQFPIDQFITDTSKKYVFVWGVSYYDDGYGNRRKTQFCHRYHAAKSDDYWRIRKDIPVGDLPVATTIIPIQEARFHTVGNDAD